MGPEMASSDRVFGDRLPWFTRRVSVKVHLDTGPSCHEVRAPIPTRPNPRQSGTRLGIVVLLVPAKSIKLPLGVEHGTFTCEHQRRFGIVYPQTSNHTL